MIFTYVAIRLVLGRIDKSVKMKEILFFYLMSDGYKFSWIERDRKPKVKVDELCDYLHERN